MEFRHKVKPVRQPTPAVSKDVDFWEEETEGFNKGTMLKDYWKGL